VLFLGMRLTEASKPSTTNLTPPSSQHPRTTPQLTLLPVAASYATTSRASLVTSSVVPSSDQSMERTAAAPVALLPLLLPAP